MIITKKSLPRRTILRGLGAPGAAAARRMVPALTAMAADRRPPGAPARRGLRAERHGDAAGRRRATGAGFELTPILQPLAPFRDRLLVSRAWTGSGIAEPGSHAAASHAIPDRRARPADRRRHAGRSFDGPDGGADTWRAHAARVARARARSPRHHRLVRRGTAAPSSTRSRGAARRRRCRWRTTRARCSSGCSARRAAPTPRHGSPISAGSQHPRFGDRGGRGSRRAVWARATALKIDEYLDGRARHRAADPEGRGAERDGAAGRGAAGRHSADFEEHTQLMFDLQVLAYQCRPDARHHVHDRAASSAAAPIRRSASPRRTTRSRTIRTTRRRSRSWPRSTPITRRCSPTISRSCGRPPTATARCSIT